MFHRDLLRVSKWTILGIFFFAYFTIFSLFISLAINVNLRFNFLFSLSWGYSSKRYIHTKKLYEYCIECLPPVFSFPPPLDLFWRLKGLLYRTEMMSLQFSVSSIQFYDNDLLFTFPTWPFSMNFSQHNSSLFFYHALTTPKVTRRQVLFVPCFISWEKSAASWTHFLSVSIFEHIFYLLLMTIFLVF